MFAFHVPLERRPTEYQVVFDKRAIDFQRVAVAAEMRQRFEEPKSVTNVYRDVSGLLKLPEKLDILDVLNKRAIVHLSLRLPAY